MHDSILDSVIVIVVGGGGGGGGGGCSGWKISTNIRTEPLRVPTLYTDNPFKLIHLEYHP